MIIDLTDDELGLIKKALYTKIDSLNTSNRKQKRYKVLLKKNRWEYKRYGGMEKNI